MKNHTTPRLTAAEAFARSQACAAESIHAQIASAIEAGEPDCEIVFLKWRLACPGIKNELEQLGYEIGQVGIEPTSAYVVSWYGMHFNNLAADEANDDAGDENESEDTDEEPLEDPIEDLATGNGISVGKGIPVGKGLPRGGGLFKRLGL